MKDATLIRFGGDVMQGKVGLPVPTSPQQLEAFLLGAVALVAAVERIESEKLGKPLLPDEARDLRAAATLRQCAPYLFDATR